MVALCPGRSRFAGFAIAALAMPALSQGGDAGYEVEVTRGEQAAPSDSVGRKRTERKKRVGNTDETYGDSSEAMFVLGGFTKKCPTAEGIVHGDFEYSLSIAEVMADSEGVHRTHFSKSAAARLEGHVGDDAMLTHVEGELSLVRSTGAPPEKYPISFRPGTYGEPDMDAMKQAVELTRDAIVAAVMWEAGQNYNEAQRQWLKNNACVEMVFEPPSDTRMAGANEVVPVSARLRAKRELAPVPGANLTLDALQDIGRVSPRSGETPEAGELTVTYTASQQPRRGHGFSVVGKSRAGVVASEWHIDELLRYEGTFTQTQSAVITEADAKAAAAIPAWTGGFGIGASANYRITGRLVWTPEAEATRPGSFGNVASTFLVPADGEITVTAESESHSRVGACTIEGSHTFPVHALPPAARQHIFLELATDGRYRLSLGMISRYLQFEATQACSAQSAPGFPVAMPGPTPVTVNDAGIVLGLQEGHLADDTIAGRTPRPIVSGVVRYEGDWSFRRVRP